MKNLVDLHLHSNHSDGVFTPEQLIVTAAGLGMRAVALADHDTVSGVDEALAAGAAAGIEVIPAVELSVEFMGYRDLHLLGYFLDHHDPELLSTLASFRERRERRGAAIVERLNERLILEGKGGISNDDVTALAEGTLGRPHIAQILIRQGAAKDMQDAFQRYLIPCDVPKRYFPMDQALLLLRRAGGATVLAHPLHITKERGELLSMVDALIPLGLDGLEAWHNGATAQDSLFLSAISRKRGLICTGGSDFHGIEEGVTIGKGWGEMEVEYGCVEELKMVCRGRKDQSVRQAPGAAASVPAGQETMERIVAAIR